MNNSIAGVWVKAETDRMPKDAGFYTCMIEKKGDGEKSQYPAFRNYNGDWFLLQENEKLLWWLNEDETNPTQNKGSLKNLFKYFQDQFGLLPTPTQVREITEMINAWQACFEPIPVNQDDIEFQKYLSEARDAFVVTMYGQDTRLRVAAENILIAFDQLRERLQQPTPVNQDDYWKKRCEAAELLLGNIGRNVNRFPGYIEWQQLKSLNSKEEVK